MSSSLLLLWNYTVHRWLMKDTDVQVSPNIAEVQYIWVQMIIMQLFVTITEHWNTFAIFLQRFIMENDLCPLCKRKRGTRAKRCVSRPLYNSITCDILYYNPLRSGECNANLSDYYLRVVPIRLNCLCRVFKTNGARLTEQPTTTSGVRLALAAAAASNKIWLKIIYLRVVVVELGYV